MSRLRQIDARTFDAVLAAVLFVFCSIEIVSADRDNALVLDLLCGALVTIPIAWIRRAPLGALLVMGPTAVVANTVLTGWEDVVIPLIALLIVSYSAGANLERGRALVALGVADATVLAVTFLLGVEVWGDVVFPILLVTVAWVAGRAVRSRTELSAELHEAAVRAEEDRQAGVQRAMADERRRIAREMHDIVAHSISVMVVQAGGARRILARDPGRAVEAAERIEGTGRAALVEMRRLLGLLQPAEGDATLAPQPTLDALDDLAQRARDAGQPVDVRVEGLRRPLPPGVDLAAYRVVQEAVTNAIKHATGAPTEVLVRYGEAELELLVADRGPGASHRNGTSGHGLVGMRERVALYGGALSAGPGLRGGFEVRATIPLEDDR